jgi:hypothetical protein
LQKTAKKISKKTAKKASKKSGKVCLRMSICLFGLRLSDYHFIFPLHLHTFTCSETGQEIGKEGCEEERQGM